MKFSVLSTSFDLSTNEPKWCGKFRTQVIDTETNELFSPQATPEEVATMVEAFWNALNDPCDGFSIFHRDTEVVKVLEVLPFYEEK